MKATANRNVVFCADDYGLSPAASRGIAALAMAGRLSAISCLANGPGWRAEAPALDELVGKVDIGLHLCLTELPPLGPMPRLAPSGRPPTIGALSLAALTGRLRVGEIRDELFRQFDVFTEVVGRSPDFLDGHQHVHALPQVRDAVMELFRSRLDPAHAYVRCCWESPLSILRAGVAPGKALALSALNLGFPEALSKAGIPATRGYRGVHGFSAETPAQVEARFVRWFAAAAPGSLINCHPGLPDHDPPMPDAIGRTRLAEWTFLASDGFPALLDRLGVRLARFQDV